jgi:hypothetical protein
MGFAVANNIKYITDISGKRKEVIIPYQIWKSITEELESLKEKQKILLGLQQACKEIKKQKRGKLKEQTLDDFIDEL